MDNPDEAKSCVAFPCVFTDQQKFQHIEIMNDNTQKPAPLKPISLEELRARRAAGHPHPGLVEEPMSMRALERALDEAHHQEGEPPIDSPAEVDREMFGTDSVTRQVSWKNRLFGSFTVSSEFGLGNPIKLDRFTVAIELFVNGNPDAITFSLKRELGEGVRLYRAQNGPLTDCTTGELVNFSVPVEWKNNPNPRGPKNIPNLIPKTRDVDLVFLDTHGNCDGRKGAFIQVEVQLCTRQGRFFLSMQQVYAGQIVRTTAEFAEKNHRQTVQVGSHIGSEIPLFPENAYPGTSLFKNFSYLADGLIRTAIECGASIPLSKCVVARWKPEKKTLPAHLLPENGWHTGNVMWFNPVIGYGYIYSDDGKTCFTHFKQIENEAGKPIWQQQGEFPHLTPMRSVAIRYEQQNQGDGSINWKALAVRPI